MKPLLKIAETIDSINNRFAVFAMWAIFVSCAISSGNAFIRFIFSKSSNGWLEIQWYLFAAAVMLGASTVLRVNEHVRVDVIYGQLQTKTKVFIDLFGLVFFLIPVMSLMMYLAWPLFIDKVFSGESRCLWPYQPPPARLDSARFGHFAQTARPILHRFRAKRR